MKKQKKLYKGKFNWKGEIHTFHSMSFSKSQVKFIFMKRLAEKLKASLSFIKGYYYFPNNKIEITEIIKE